MVYLAQSIQQGSCSSVGCTKLDFTERDHFQDMQRNGSPLEFQLAMAKTPKLETGLSSVVRTPREESLQTIHAMRRKVQDTFGESPFKVFG